MDNTSNLIVFNMENINNLNRNNQSVLKLPKIGDILGAPLVAAVSANSTMVREQTKFLMETCFVSKGNNLYEPMMIEMSLSRFIEDDRNESGLKEINTTFQIPLLTLVPMNSLVVDSVEVDFSLEIVSQSASQSSVQIKGEKDNSSNSNILKNDVQFSGKLSYDSNDKASNRTHNASKLNVKIQTKSIQLPLGVTSLIDMYIKSINVLPK